MRNTCFGVMRFFGLLGFLGAVFATLQVGKQLLGLEMSFAELSAGELEGRPFWLVLASIVIGMLGTIIGQAIGAAIPINNDKLDLALSFTWHAFANASIIWIILSGTALGLEMGDAETAKAFISRTGHWRLLLVICASAAVAGILIMLSHLLCGGELAWLAWSLSVAFGVVGGWVQSMVLGTSIFGGLVTGLVLPLVLVPLTGHSLELDRQRREQGGAM